MVMMRIASGLLLLAALAGQTHADASVATPRPSTGPTVQVQSLRWPAWLPCGRFTKLRMRSLKDAAISWTGRNGSHTVRLTNRSGAREIIEDVPEPDFPVGLSSIQVNATPDASPSVMLLCSDAPRPPRISWQLPGHLVVVDLPDAVLPPPFRAPPSELEVRFRLKTLLSLVCNEAGCGARPRIAFETLRSPYRVSIRTECAEPGRSCKANVGTNAADFDWSPFESCSDGRADPLGGACEVGDELRFEDGAVRIFRRGAGPVQVELSGNAIKFR